MLDCNRGNPFNPEDMRKKQYRDIERRMVYEKSDKKKEYDSLKEQGRCIQNSDYECDKDYLCMTPIGPKTICQGVMPEGMKRLLEV